MTDALDVNAALPLLLAPIALMEGWRRRVPRSHLELLGDAPRDVIAAQLGAYDTLVLSRRSPAVVVPHDGATVIALGFPPGASAPDWSEQLARITKWEDAGITFESLGGTYALFQSTEQSLLFDLPAGKYEGWTSRPKIGGKTVVLVRLVRSGPRTPPKYDIELPPELSDADFAAAEALEWTTLSSQVAVVVDDRGTCALLEEPPPKPTRAGDALVLPSGQSMLSWVVPGGLLIAGSNLGDAADNVAALLAIPAKRFEDTGLTLAVPSAKLRLYDAEGEDETTTVRLAQGTYRVGFLPKLVTAAAELVSIVRLTKV